MTTRRRQPKTIDDRAAEYVDSPLMTQRLQYKREISARIEGNYGVYRTRLQLGRRGDSSCTCPSDWWPCKHVRALAATWDAKPESFVDLEQLLKDLSTRPQKMLVQALAEMVLVAPECLAGLGVPGFQIDTEDEESGEEGA